MTPDRPILNSENFPQTLIEPMKPRLVQYPIRNPNWIAEIKLNGFRAVTYLQKGQTPIVRTSTGRDVAGAFPELRPGLERLAKRHSLILDGEVVYGEGKTEEEMRKAVGRTSGTPFTTPYNSEHFPCQYAVFDLLYVDGIDLTHLPLSERKTRLARLVTTTHSKSGIIRSLYTSADKNLDGIAREKGYEGVVYKDPKSPYIPGQITSMWLKYKFPRSR